MSGIITNKPLVLVFIWENNLNRKSTKYMNIFEILDSNEFKERLSSVMLEPRKLERFLAIAKTELRNNPRIASCEIKSLMRCDCSSCSIWFRVERDARSRILNQQGNACQLIIGYKGMLALGYRSEKLLSLEVQKVCKNDMFKRRHGDNKGLEHEPNDKEDRGEVIGYYAYAHLANHDKAFEYMSMDDIEA